MATVTDQTLPDPTFHLVEAHDHEHGSGGGTLLGFWIYLMSDALLFAAVFASFGVLSTSYAGGHAIVLGATDRRLKQRVSRSTPCR